MRVGVCGAGGRMGREVCRAVAAEDDLDLVCAIDPAFAGVKLNDIVAGMHETLEISGDRDVMAEMDLDAMVDFSIASAARENVSYALATGIPCVVGTTGFEGDDLDEFDRLSREGDIGCILAPNFAIGAVLMMDFARRAGRFMQACEIIELHHSAKLDAPSGTARNTARLILEAREDKATGEEEEGPRGLNMGGIHLHSVRLPGLVAHQEVIFGGLGQTLTLRHDSYDRSSFMPGVIMALRKVGDQVGLVVGLERILEL